MIKYSRLKAKAREKKFKIGLDAYSVLEGLVDKILDLAIDNARKSKSIKLMKEHFDGIVVNIKKQ